MSEIAVTLAEAGLQLLGEFGRSQYSLSYELSPIILTNGIAANVPGGMVPIISIIQSQSFPTGLLSGGGSITIANAFATFRPVIGGTLIDQQLGKYPFANQAVAANAVIVQPLRIAVLMMCPARQPGDMLSRLQVITSLQSVLAKHNISGGTYTIATPSFFYTDCVMIAMRDASSAASQQPQNQWVLEFEKPLVTLQQATQAQNSLMNKISSGVPVAGDPPSYSGQNAGVGNPQSGLGPSTIPASTPLTGSSVGGTPTQGLY